MASSFQASYVYARLCGSFARSCVGERAAALARLGRVGELWKGIFNEEPPPLSEPALVAAAELRTMARAREAFTRIAGPTAAEEPVFVALLRKDEFAQVKRIVLAVKEGGPRPSEPELRSWSPDYDISAYPELEGIFARGRFSWIPELGLDDPTLLRNRLDRQYYAELWDSLNAVGEELLGSIRGLVRLEAELQNLVWALRLRRYYAYKAEQIEGLLIRLGGLDVAGTARAALGFRGEVRGDWNGWRYEALVNGPAKPGEDWYLDIPRFEAELRLHLYRRLKRGLHAEPFSYAPLYCYYRLREYETASILGLIEGAQLGMAAEELAGFALGTGGGRE
ncbi:MAG TPA: V-type ATPase subunit [Rectinemataceae bacterium]|nr:V-type ATPase subunit [Rectinemataceae bacterium]